MKKDEAIIEEINDTIFNIGLVSIISNILSLIFFKGYFFGLILIISLIIQGSKVKKKKSLLTEQKSKNNLANKVSSSISFITFVNAVLGVIQIIILYSEFSRQASYDQGFGLAALILVVPFLFCNCIMLIVYITFMLIAKSNMKK